jgi:hypothetical protein
MQLRCTNPMLTVMHDHDPIGMADQSAVVVIHSYALSGQALHLVRRLAVELKNLIEMRQKKKTRHLPVCPILHFNVIRRDVDNSTAKFACRRECRSRDTDGAEYAEGRDRDS